MAVSPDLLRATLDSVILEVIAGGSSYGYAIAQAIESSSHGELLTKEGTLYPALHRLEQRGYLAAKWEPSPEGRRRKHYRLTAKGKRHREQLREQWISFSRTVDRILGITNAGLCYT